MSSSSPDPDRTAPHSKSPDDVVDSERPSSSDSISTPLRKTPEPDNQADDLDTQASTSDSVSPTAAPSAGDWQAIWSSQYNTYYFYNSATQETTWVNPLQPTPEPAAEAGPVAAAPSASSTLTSTSEAYDIYTAAAVQGIDPSLAHLDPSLAAGPSAPSAFTYAAKFNARTGAFTRPDGRASLTEYERARRMSEFYFDVNAWEQDVEARKLQEAQEEAKGTEARLQESLAFWLQSYWKEFVCRLQSKFVFAWMIFVSPTRSTPVPVSTYQTSIARP
ncbi:hypothetical protein A0H81_03341 [Grifola frondosa]|uniref:WW domain-containing protein n=1 Tax=Grifola frondosa TaxID=5627 RepID=A0A1C7MJG0_GRIFR|nr:hypothetical protein A0H81_03341 [Grifola frondosa]